MTAALRRSLTLPAEDRRAPALARRALRELLDEAGRLADADVAELALTELVTNAALHAHTEVEVTVCVSPDEVRVEVRDHSPELPVARHYGRTATTGRGMALVQSLTSSCGVTPLGSDGKVVWFVLSTGPAAAEPTADALLDAWADAEWDVEGWEDDWEVAGPPVEAAAAPGEVAVVLPAFPPTLWLAARQHHDALLRELVLHAAEHPGVDGPLDLAAADLARTTVSTALLSEIARAQQDGRARPALPEGHPSPLPDVPAALDLQVPVAAQQSIAFLALQQVLDAAEGLALQGALLSRPGLPEVVAVRDWVCDQVQAQVAGGAPSPWPGTAQPRFETEAVDLDVAHPDLPQALASGRGVVAADEANRIIGISEPLARALGWDPHELVGRRLVTLIPPDLREGHIAGFTRHLATGESHILGVPLQLPVLHRDGSTVTCRFVVDQLPPRGGRSVYLAWIDPV